MALTFNAQAKNDIAAFVSSKLSDGWLEMYDGTLLLVRFHLPIAAFSARPEGGYRLAGEWSGAARNNGVARRFVVTDRNATWTVEGTVSGSGGAGDLQLANTELTFGEHVNITAFNIEL